MEITHAINVRYSHVDLLDIHLNQDRKICPRLFFDFVFSLSFGEILLLLDSTQHEKKHGNCTAYDQFANARILIHTWRLNPKVLSLMVDNQIVRTRMAVTGG